jgi:hypothetical protein
MSLESKQFSKYIEWQENNTSYQRQSFQLHIDWNILALKVVLVQLDDDGWKFVLAYVN